MAVSFERYGRLYYLDPGEYQPKIGDKVLVPTDGGPEVAECVWAPQWVPEDVEGLPVCAGLAEAEDLARDDENRRRRAEGRLASQSAPEATLRRIQAVMRCRERLTLNVAPLLAVEEMTLSLARG